MMIKSDVRLVVITKAGARAEMTISSSLAMSAVSAFEQYCSTESLRDRFLSVRLRDKEAPDDPKKDMPLAGVSLDQVAMMYWETLDG